MTISAEQVKELREKTGAGMMDCKKALAEAKGDITQANEILRKKGIAVAAKKSARVAADGTIGHYYKDDGTLGILVEVNCETDFVTKTEDFQNYVATATNLIKEKAPQDIDAYLSLDKNGTSIKDLETQLVAKIGEKLGTRRFARWEVNGNKNKIAQYIHAGNKIGVMVEFTDPAGKLDNNKAREVAMHVAAMHPQYVTKDDVPESVIAKEKEIFLSQMADQKKPPEILEKIATGKLGKYFSEVCLDNQVFVCDPEGKNTVAKALQTIDAGIKVNRFIRIQVGEGIEKRKD
ncbi:MAG: translation elongation factor Ts [Pseudomonadota bacterium]